MKRIFYLPLILFIGIAVMLSCRKESDNNYHYDYPYLILSELSNLNEQGVTASGEIKNLGTDSIIDFGLVWCPRDTPTIYNFKLSITGKPKIGSFTGRLNNSIDPNTVYNVRPFIQTDKYLVYGNVLQFKGLGSLLPKISDFEPKEGKRKSLVTIIGENFNANAEVYFGTEKAKVIKSGSTEIIAEVPSGIGNVKISVHQNLTVEAGQLFNFLYPWTKISLPDELLLIEYPCGFSAAGKGYIFGGYSNATNNYTRHLWEYNPVTNSWTLKADFPGEARRFAVCMVINNKAYIGLGDNGTSTSGFSDFWEYDPSIDTWTRKADFPLLNYGRPASTSVGNLGYIGLGLEGYSGSGGQPSSKFWSYDPQADTWLRISDYPVENSMGNAFGVQKKLYAGAGFSADFYELDPLINIWTNRHTYPGNGRWDISNFVIGDLVYLGLGQASNSTIINDFWEFKPSDNSWTRLIDYPAADKAREVFASFSINDKGYIFDSRYESSSFKGSFWEFDPSKNY